MQVHALAPLSVRLHRVADAQRGRLMPWLAVAMAAGVLGYFSLTAEPPLAAGPGACGVLLCLLVALRNRALARSAAALALAASAGFTAAGLAAWRAPPWDALPRTAVIITAPVAAVEVQPDGRRLTLAAARLDGGEPVHRTLHVRLRATDQTPVATGDLVRIRAVLLPPAPPAYPGAADFQRDAYFTGLGGGGMAFGAVTVLGQTPGSSPQRWLQALREHVASRFLAGLPGADGAVAATMLTGLGAAIPPDVRRSFQDSGLAHLLAVAGLHIGIVMGLVMGAVRSGLALWPYAALRWPCKPLAAAAALLAGALYVLLSGAHVPVVRSFAMASLVTLGIATGRPAFSLRGLALAAMVVMLVSPDAVGGVSFQMSFAAVLALIAGHQAMRPAMRRLRARRVLHHLAGLALTSALAGAASAPFGAYHFGRLQLYFILANMAAVPLTAFVIMPAGLLALTLMPLGLEQVALWPMGRGVDSVLWIARATSALPDAALAIPRGPPWGLALVALGLAWLCLWRGRWRLLGAPVLAGGLLAGLVAPPADLLVSADAKLIAWRSPGYIQTRPGAARFVHDAMERYWAETLATPFPELAPTDSAACTPDGCRVGGRILLARSLHPMDCTGAVLVVSAEPAAAICPALPHIDRFAVWRNGPYAVWLGAEPRILSDRANRGDRPWVYPAPAARPVRTTLPLAMQE